MEKISSERKDEIIVGLIGELDEELFDCDGESELIDCLQSVMSEEELRAYVNNNILDEYEEEQEEG